MTFDFSFILNLIPIMAKYSGVTIKLSLMAIMCGFILSMVIAFVMYARVMILSQFFKVYISFFRGTPLMAQLFCFYFGIVPIFPEFSLKFSSFTAALIVLSLASSAYMAESLRAALNAVHKGQVEAAKSIGMNYFQSMTRIIFPQALRIAVPTLFSSFINIVKDMRLGLKR